MAVTVTVTPPPGAGEARMDTCSVTVNAADPTGVTVTPTTLELAPGYTGRLTAAVFPETAPQTVAWRSEDPAIAQVDDTGMVTGIGARKDPGGGVFFHPGGRLHRDGARASFWIRISWRDGN